MIQVANLVGELVWIPRRLEEAVARAILAAGWKVYRA